MATSKANGKKKTTVKKASKSKKKTAPKRAKKATSSAKPTKPAKSQRKTAKITDADKQKMIEEAAYYIAQQRNFSAGNAMDDWLAAEEQVNKLL